MQGADPQGANQSGALHLPPVVAAGIQRREGQMSAGSIVEAFDWYLLLIIFVCFCFHCI
jgi:hypothetical protein